MEQRTLKNVNNYLNTNIYSYLETCGGQSYNLYFNAVHFLTPVLIRHLRQLKTVVFLHWCLICAFLLKGTTTFSMTILGMFLRHFGKTFFTVKLRCVTFSVVMVSGINLRGL